MELVGLAGLDPVREADGLHEVGFAVLLGLTDAHRPVHVAATGLHDAEGAEPASVGPLLPEVRTGDAVDRTAAVVGQRDGGDDEGAVAAQGEHVQRVVEALAVGSGGGGDGLALLGHEERGRGSVAGAHQGADRLLLTGLALLLHPQDVVGDLHAAVAGSGLLVVLPTLLGHGFGGASALGHVLVVRSELGLQVISDGLGPLLRQGLVVVVPAHAVGVTDDGDRRQLGVGLLPCLGRDLVQDSGGLLRQLGLVEGEQHVRVQVHPLLGGGGLPDPLGALHDAVQVMALLGDGAVGHGHDDLVARPDAPVAGRLLGRSLIGIPRAFRGVHRQAGHEALRAGEGHAHPPGVGG